MLWTQQEREIPLRCVEGASEISDLKTPIKPKLAAPSDSSQSQWENVFCSKFTRGNTLKTPSVMTRDVLTASLLPVRKHVHQCHGDMFPQWLSEHSTDVFKPQRWDDGFGACRLLIPAHRRSARKLSVNTACSDTWQSFNTKKQRLWETSVALAHESTITCWISSLAPKSCETEVFVCFIIS